MLGPAMAVAGTAGTAAVATAAVRRPAVREDGANRPVRGRRHGLPAGRHRGGGVAGDADRRRLRLAIAVLGLVDGPVAAGVAGLLPGRQLLPVGGQAGREQDPDD